MVLTTFVLVYESGAVSYGIWIVDFILQFIHYISLFYRVVEKNNGNLGSLNLILGIYERVIRFDESRSKVKQSLIVIKREFYM